MTIPPGGTGGRIVLHSPDNTQNPGYVWEVGVALAGEGMHAQGVVDIPCPESGQDAELVSFFQDLAESWRGWEGTRTWESFGSVLRIDATHDGFARVTISAMLTPLYEDWSARVAVQAEPGEQLSRIAADVRELLERDGESRDDG